MPSSSFFRLLSRRVLASAVALSLSLLVVTGWYLTSRPGSPARSGVKNIGIGHFQAGPPWRYGKADSRFTVALFADLECPYCKSYYPVLKAWVDRHPESNLQWHHFPLPLHEPAASRQARLAECAGESDGNAAFWRAVTWIYQQTRSDGAGIPDNIQYPALTPTMQGCLDSTRPEAVVQTQANEGSRDGVTATPTLMLRDNQNSRTLVLHGPVEGDALLSALDLLSADGSKDDGDSAT
ncbi:MAG: thioredoxin domain-containing protein [Enterobacteriaceae bacterium]|nr:thioredoxin domain-containing protein [Enterobacteriaceae bacterium]